MGTTNNLGNDEQLASELQDCAKLLVEKLQSNEFADASTLIQNLFHVRDRHMFHSVGKLTRALHNAIVNFNVDAGVHTDKAHQNLSEISDASDRLQYVINMTQAAADKTMDRVETAAPIAMNLGQEAAILRVEWEKLKRRELDKEGFAQLYNRVGDFLEQLGDGAAQLNENLQAIILEQGYQDLTGQVLKKVIGLITDVEKELVNLVRIAGQVEEVTGIVYDKKEEIKTRNGLEGPQVHANKRNDIVHGQDDVDDLLSSLGF